MSKDNQINTIRPQVITIPWYKKPAFPWALIVGSILLFSGIIIGWTGHVNQQAQVTAEANHLFSQLKSK